MNPTDIKWIQVEATTKCNAWCPGCARNKGGYELADHLVVEDLDINRYAELLAQFPNLETVDFCGTHGDAIAAANIIELTTLTKKYAKTAEGYLVVPSYILGDLLENGLSLKLLKKIKS